MDILGGDQDIRAFDLDAEQLRIVDLAQDPVDLAEQHVPFAGEGNGIARCEYSGGGCLHDRAIAPHPRDEQPPPP